MQLEVPRLADVEKGPQVIVGGLVKIIQLTNCAASSAGRWKRKPAFSKSATVVSNSIELDRVAIDCSTACHHMILSN